MNKFEVIFTSICFLTYFICAIFFSSVDTWLIFLSVVLYIFNRLFHSKASSLCFIFSIVSYLIYIFYCYKTKYFGEISYSVVIIIMDIVTLLVWNNGKNTEKKDIKINKLGKTELIVSFSVLSAITICCYFILRALGSGLCILNTFSNSLALAVIYFDIRKSRLANIISIFASAIYIAVWIVSASTNFAGPALICSVNGLFELVWNVYGAIKWQNMYKAQNTLVE